MSERAGLSGADFQITSDTGKGTTIRVEWDV
jgi:signal transduction histidine kinase